jgi:hypothetical protein
MPLLEDIQVKIRQDRFEFSRHALDQSIRRRVHVHEIREALETGEVIEDYPEDKHGPSCLILGITERGRALHVQCSYPTRALVKVITLYEPDPARWIDSRRRRTE